MKSIKERHKEQLKEFEKDRETYRLVLPTGLNLTMIKLELLEALEIYEVIGIKLEDMGTGDHSEMGARLVGRVNEVLDKFVSRIVVKTTDTPGLRPAGETCDDNELNTSDLNRVEKWALIDEVIKRSVGGGAKAAADSFPGKPKD